MSVNEVFPFQFLPPDGGHIVLLQPKENIRTVLILGHQRQQGGNRGSSGLLISKNKNGISFNPTRTVSNEMENLAANCKQT